jgi:hypothetical protein
MESRRERVEDPDLLLSPKYKVSARQEVKEAVVVGDESVTSCNTGMAGCFNLPHGNEPTIAKRA